MSFRKMLARVYELKGLLGGSLPSGNSEEELIIIVTDGFELEPMATLLLAETDRVLGSLKPVAKTRA